MGVPSHLYGAVLEVEFILKVYLNFSYLFWCIFSVVQCTGISPLISGFLSEEIDPRVVVYSACLWVEGKSRAFYSAIWLKIELSFSFRSILFGFGVLQLHYNMCKCGFHLTYLA